MIRWTASSRHHADGESASVTYGGVGNVTNSTDSNGSLVFRNDSDSYTTEYIYNTLDLVINVNYNNKGASYGYNNIDDLAPMIDWFSMTTSELGLLHQLTAPVNHKGNRVEYIYDGVSN